MTEIREIFETVRTYCGMMFGDEKAARQLGSEAAKRNLDAKMPRCIEASVTKEDTKLLRHYGTKVVSDNNSLETVFSRFTSHFSLPKAAFTLAEVLITLGIIGVVAALTLPTLIQNHQKQVYVTQLKKAYSTLNNAINNLAAQQGVTEWSQIDWGADSNEVCGEETKFFDCMGNYLFSCSNCTTEVQSLKFLANQMKAVKYKPVGRDCSAEFYYSSVGDSFCKASTVWITPDGMTFLFLVGSYTMAYIDVNGTAKGPNIGGRDVFLLFAVNGNKLTPDGILSSQADEWKNCSATNLSTSCTAKVLIEGKMNY